MQLSFTTHPSRCLTSTKFRADTVNNSKKNDIFRKVNVFGILKAKLFSSRVTFPFCDITEKNISIRSWNDLECKKKIEQRGISNYFISFNEYGTLQQQLILSDTQ